MDNKKYSKLEELFENKSFKKDNETLEKVFYIFSWVGNALSLFFAFFFVKSSLLNIDDGYSDNIFVMFIVILLLACIELMKREVLKIITVNYLKYKMITNKTILSFISISVLVSFACYMTISGSSKFADSSSKVENKYEIIKKQEIDSVNKEYINEKAILKKENERISANIELTQQKIDEIDKELQDDDYLLERNEKREKKTKIKELKYNITKLEDQISYNKKDLIKKDSIINKNEQSIIEKYNLKQSKETIVIGYNKIFYFLFALLIELLIIFGVCYHWVFLYKTYEEKKADNNKNPDYKYRLKQLELLKIIYNNGSKKQNEQVIPDLQFKNLIKSQKLPYSQKDVLNFLLVIKDLGIIRVEGRKRFFNLDYAQAKEKF